MNNPPLLSAQASAEGLIPDDVIEEVVIAVSGLATAMQKIPQEPKHQRTVSYKCCGCSRFFSEKDWPRCPHCGAEATRL